MKRVLVTGAYGFLGRYVARVFAEKKWQVQGIGHGSWNEKEWKSWGLSEWHNADINLNTLMTYAGEPDVIVHCAGSANVAFSMKYPHQDFQRSVSTTLDVLEYARAQTPVPVVAFPSSAAVYGKTSALPIKEDHPLVPISPYGVHKKICEALIESYARHFGVSAGVVRFFSIYGNGLRKQIFWDACNRLSRGEHDFFGSGEETRDFLQVEDAARLLYAAAANANTGCPVVNGGTGIKTSIAQLIKTIGRELPGEPRPVFSGNARPGDPDNYQADTGRARAWGWAPQCKLKDGIAEYVRWYEQGTTDHT